MRGAVLRFSLRCSLVDARPFTAGRRGGEGTCLVARDRLYPPLGHILDDDQSTRTELIQSLCVRVFSTRPDP